MKLMIREYENLNLHGKKLIITKHGACYDILGYLNHEEREFHLMENAVFIGGKEMVDFDRLKENLESEISDEGDWIGFGRLYNPAKKRHFKPEDIHLKQFPNYISFIPKTDNL